MNDANDFEAIIPSSTQAPEVKKEECIISNESLLGIYAEIIDNLREDRKEIKDLASNFVNMVVNDGDASPASKEALVNLLKIQSETADKMAKIADLMTRIKLKDTLPRYLGSSATTINVADNSAQRSLLKSIDQYKKELGKKK